MLVARPEAAAVARSKIGEDLMTMIQFFRVLSSASFTFSIDGCFGSKGGGLLLMMKIKAADAGFTGVNGNCETKSDWCWIGPIGNDAWSMLRKWAFGLALERSAEIIEVWPQCNHNHCRSFQLNITANGQH